jgi:replicative DNA helicase
MHLKDVFISHASEDKLEVARPLAALLVQLGLRVWLDEAELLLGDSLRRKIEHGLSTCRFGVVILSKSFFSKEWPQKELDALVAREDGSEKVILPVWHEITASDVRRYSPLLADRLGINTDRGLAVVASEIARAVRPHATEPVQAEAAPAAHSHPKPIDQLIVEWIDRVNEIHESGAEVAGLRTGFHDLDLLLGGFSPGELYVMAARPSVGCTTLALNFTRHVTVAEGLPAVYYSLHSRSHEIITRLIAAHGRIDRWHLASARLTDQEWNGLSEAVTQVHSAPMYVDDTSPLSLAEIDSRTQALHQRTGAVGLVVIDSLDLVRDKGDQPIDASDLPQLASLARRINCAVLLLCSIDGVVDRRTDKRPSLTDMSHAASLEQIAAAIFLLYRDDHYNPHSSEAGTLDLIVARNRGGVTGTIRLAYSKETGRMDSLAFPAQENDA